MNTPRAVLKGWNEIFLLGASTQHGDESLPGMALVGYPDGRVAFRHVCDRGDRGVIVCAPFLQTETGGHRVVSRHPWTIAPSILCPDCGTHGFVRDGSWVAA
jgi:hypothetical protein